jgi:hypothetical protein
MNPVKHVNLSILVLFTAVILYCSLKITSLRPYTYFVHRWVLFHGDMFVNPLYCKITLKRLLQLRPAGGLEYHTIDFLFSFWMSLTSGKFFPSQTSHSLAAGACHWALQWKSEGPQTRSGWILGMAWSLRQSHWCQQNRKAVHFRKQWRMWLMQHCFHLRGVYLGLFTMFQMKLKLQFEFIFVSSPINDQCLMKHVHPLCWDRRNAYGPFWP